MAGMVARVVETVRVEVAVPPGNTVIRVAVKEEVGPDGETPSDKATVPEKPFRLVKVIVETTGVPA